MVSGVSAISFASNPIMRTQAVQKYQQQQNNDARQALINKNYRDIYAHESAHKAAGGPLAGAIVIETNEEGIPVGGHVAIMMPVLRPDNPQKTIDDANTVVRAAMAPADPSGQDFKVAAQARNIRAEAENIKQKKKIDYYA